MPLPPGSNRYVPHFEDPELEHLSRLTFNGIRDLNEAIKALNTKANATQSQSAALAAAVTTLNTLVQQNTTAITNINNTTIVSGAGNIDCGTFEAIYR